MTVPLIRCTVVPPCGHCWYCEQAAKPKPLFTDEDIVEITSHKPMPLKGEKP